MLTFAALVLIGFIACAELGSFLFVHPALRRLPRREYIIAQQGLLKTFGRFMPVGMTAATVAAIAIAVDNRDAYTITAGAAALVALVTTIVVNVPINIQTGRWNPESPPHTWQKTRRLWWVFQGARGLLFFVAFVALAARATLA